MEFVQDLLYVLITAAVPVLVTYLCKFLYTKWTQVKTNIKNDKIAIVLEQVVNAVLTCVKSVQQTFVDELKKKGEFTKEAAKEAFDKCKAMVLQMLSEEAKEIIAEIYGDVDVFLDELIESKVYDIKK